MPEYLSLLRSVSTYSIFTLFAFVALLRILKGKIFDREIWVFFNIWLPLFVVAQIVMTVSARIFHNNIPILNAGIFIELPIMLYIFLRIRRRLKSTSINLKFWVAIVLGVLLVHLFEGLYEIHNYALLLTAIIYFHITISIVDQKSIDWLGENGFYKHPLFILNLGLFTKAFAYSYFLIYLIDYKFPLAIYSGLNILIQFIFAMAIWRYYSDFRVNRLQPSQKNID